VDNLAKEPWPPIAPAANHQTVGARFLQSLIGRVEVGDVAVGDYRDPDALLDCPDKPPISRSRIELTAGTSVHCYHSNAACFGNPGEPRCVTIVLVPAGAHLQGNRQVDRPDRRFENPRRMSLIAHQRRAGMAVDDLFYRTAEIDGYDPRTGISVELRRLGHDLGVAACELHRHRLLFGTIARHRQRLPGLADHRLAGDHFRHDETRPQLLDETPER